MTCELSMTMWWLGCAAGSARVGGPLTSPIVNKEAAERGLCAGMQYKIAK
jgi:hypothetical protein